MKKERDLGLQIYKQLGGIKNVSLVGYSMTRLQIKVHDRQLVNLTKLRQIPEVIGVFDKNMLKVVLRPELNVKVAQAMQQIAEENNLNVAIYTRGLIKLFAFFRIIIPRFRKKNGSRASRKIAYIYKSSAKALQAEVRAQSNLPKCNMQILAPVSGNLIKLADVDDQVFSSKTVGDGIAIIPKSSELIAPITGQITCIMPTKHALIIRSQIGDFEVLIHIGLDTGKLKGIPFKIKVTEGMQVQAGQVIAKADFKAIMKAGKDPVVIVTIPNMNCVQKMEKNPADFISVGKPVIKINNN